MVDACVLRRRVEATVAAIRQDAAAEGLYSRVWHFLRRRGLTAPPGDRAAVAADLRKVRCRSSVTGKWRLT